MELMAEAVNAVLKELNIGNCLMVGHSMGGYVALAFTGKYQKKVKGLTLFHSQAAADTPEAQTNRDRTIRLVGQDKKGFIQNFIPGLFDTRDVGQYGKEISHLKAVANSMPKEAIIAALEGMKVRPDRTHILAQVRVPVQFIIGKNDPRIPLELVIPQTLLPSHSEVVILDEVGHMGFIESRQETFEAVRHFALKVLQ
jgi:pimeloyl-ACP methyl ester carboxylesterase